MALQEPPKIPSGDNLAHNLSNALNNMLKTRIVWDLDWEYVDNGLKALELSHTTPDGEYKYIATYSLVTNTVLLTTRKGNDFGTHKYSYMVETNALKLIKE